MTSVTIFNKISQASLYLLAVLIPPWFLPITQDMVEYQKQALLVVLVLVGCVSWLAKMVYSGELRLRVSWLHLSALGVLAAAGISTLFSASPYASFWGWPLNVTDNLVTLAGFAALSFFISQAVKDAKQLLGILGLFVGSFAVAVIFAFLQLKGVFLLPFEFAQAAGFNTLGSANEIAMLCALVLPLALALAASQKKVWKGVLWACALILFFGLMLLDFFAAWIVAMAGLGVWLVFDITRSKKAQRISLPMVFVLIALFFAVVGNVSIPGAPVKPAEVSLNYRGELAIMRSLITQQPLQGIVGTGPGTFAYEYAQFRPAQTNQTVFWNTRFSAGKAELLDWAITKGLVGILAFFVLLALCGFSLLQKLTPGAQATREAQTENDISIHDMFGRKDAQDTALAAGLLAVLCGFTVSLLLYPANFMVWVVFWMAVGGIAFVTGKQKSISLTTGPSFVALASSLALMVVIIAGVSLGFVGSQKYYAEVVYTKGAAAAALGNTQEAIEKVQSAAAINGSVDIYWRSLAQLYLNQANAIAEDAKTEQTQRQQQTGVAVNNAIQAAQLATEVAPSNVANWNVRGFIYRSLIGVPGAENLAIEWYEKAKQLEPGSPFSWTELGRVKILAAQAGSDGTVGAAGGLQGAIADLEQAIELKPDYAPAHYLLAVAYDQLGNQAEAIAKLEQTKQVAPQDVGLAFQLGVIYYRQAELGKARDEFERAKSLNVSYANARYMLGLVYDRLGRRQDAIAEFAAVAALNPDNQEVRTILSNLAAGRAALEGIGQPSNPPIDDIPPELTEEE